MLHKNDFGQKNFNFLEMCHFRKIEKLTKLHFWTPAFDKNIHKMSQGLPWFKSAKVQNEGFLKKSCEIWKNIFVLGLYESLERMEG